MSHKKKIRIGGAQGFWGDWQHAPLQLTEKGQVDYLVFDYLAEVTMSILAKQKDRDPKTGYAKDFPLVIKKLASSLADKKLKIVANAGGLNPVECANKCLELLIESGISKSSLPKIAIVLGDNIFPDYEKLKDKGIEFHHFETGEPLSTLSPLLKSMNAYTGGEEVSKALDSGADIVIAGRVADPCLTLGILAHEFSWSYTDWNKMACGIIAGHTIECGAQVTGGNFSAGWNMVKHASNIGFPIVECYPDGSFIVTKPNNTGGLVNTQTVSEQLIYEIGDPKNYYTPDVIVDFTSISLKENGENKVLVSPAQGKQRPDRLKVSASYFDGFATEGTLVLVGPKVLEKASICEQILRERITKTSLHYKDLIFEYLGAFSCIPGLREKLQYPEPAEIVFRAAIHTQEKKDAELFSREITPLVLGGPSGVTGYAGGKQNIREVYSYFPTLIDRSYVTSRAEIIQ